MFKRYKVLELYSGIGGMHYAFNDTGLPGEIVAAVDINTLANSVYKHNFPDTIILNRAIESLSIDKLNSYNVDIVLMSPPCQPFTRNGNQLDIEDPRTKSFLYMLNILKKLNKVKYVLMENVKGFETSACRNKFIKTLIDCGFDYQEYLLTPKQLGFPNSRLRYYCLAKKIDSLIHNENKQICYELPKCYKEPNMILNYLESDVPDSYQLSDYFLGKIKCLDIVYKDSTNSCCFTKAYTHYADGTGSVYCPQEKDVSENIISKIKQETDVANFIDQLKELKLRFFTPEEVKSLMAFPKYFSFPENVTRKQKYRLLGNSINVKVVSELIKILLT